MYGQKCVQLLTLHLDSCLNRIEALTLAPHKTFMAEMDGKGLGARC